MTRLRSLWVDLTEPLVHWGGRARCRLLGLHGRGCRGRVDHAPVAGVGKVIAPPGLLGRGRWIDYRAPWRWWAHDTWHAAAYWVRPFDQLADGRRWRWQRPAPCGRQLPPTVRSALIAWAETLAGDRCRETASGGMMSPMQPGIVEFLTARLDEDQALAQPLDMDRKGEMYSDGSGIATADGFPSYPWGQEPEELAFMAGPGHPARVLAEVEAKRATLAAHRPVRFTDVSLDLVDVEVCSRCHVRLDYPDGWDEQRAAGWTYPLVPERFPCGTVRALLTPFAEHPHFHPAWSPRG